MMEHSSGDSHIDHLKELLDDSLQTNVVVRRTTCRDCRENIAEDVEEELERELIQEVNEIEAFQCEIDRRTCLCERKILLRDSVNFGNDLIGFLDLLRDIRSLSLELLQCGNDGSIVKNTALFVVQCLQ